LIGGNLRRKKSPTSSLSVGRNPLWALRDHGTACDAFVGAFFKFLLALRQIKARNSTFYFLLFLPPPWRLCDTRRLFVYLSVGWLHGRRWESEAGGNVKAMARAQGAMQIAV